MLVLVTNDMNFIDPCVQDDVDYNHHSAAVQVTTNFLKEYKSADKQGDCI